MQISELNTLLLETLDDSKAMEVVSLDVTQITSIADYFIICSGNSNRHVKAIANAVVDAAKEKGISPVSIEGDNKSEWILVDLADIVVHILIPQTRAFYNLEKLWSIEADPQVNAN